MRYRAFAALATAIFVLGIAGCAVPRHPSGDLQAWSTEQASSGAQRSSYRPYGLSVNPYQGPSGSKPDEFNFSHPRVDNFVTRFQTNLRGFFSGALSRSGRYVPRMSSILQSEGVPQELAYLPLIESGFRLQAVSRAGAVGPWQLIPGTGRRYGLRIDRYVDERCDPVKSTQAAARYLKDLHQMFGDWHLSLAAYNTGEGNITRILEEGHADDFWEMSERGYLYQETEDFVPEFLAALQIAETPEAYGFEVPAEEPMSYDLVKISRSMPLSTVARLSGATTQDIKELNPALHRGVTPPREYSIRVPKGSKEMFEVAYADLAHSKVRAPRGAPTRSVRRGKGKPRKHHGHAVAAVKAPAKVARVRKASGAKPGRSTRGPAIARRSSGQVVVAKQKAHRRVLD